MDRKSAALRVIATSAKVLAVLGIVVALVVQVISHRRRHEGRSRERGEMDMLTAALELYHSDHGEYPRSADTDRLAPNYSDDPAAYIPAAVFLYDRLAAPVTANRTGTAPRAQYLVLSPPQLRTDTNGRKYMIDPWGNPYRYSTIKAAHPNSRGGNNDTYDLWTTHGGATAKARSKWVKNW